MVASVTFVIAHYEAQATLLDAVESALAQTGVRTDVIVVDDASPHGVPDSVSNHPSGRVLLIERATNGGPGAARNDGFAAATGEWIAVLDSDDIVVADRCRAMLKNASQFDVVVDNLLLEDTRSSDPNVRPMFAPRKWSRIDRINLAAYITANRLFVSRHNLGYLKPVFSRAFLDAKQICYDSTLEIGEDYLFLASALALGARCGAVSNAGYVYRLRQGSVSRELKLRHVKQMQRGDRMFEHAFDSTFDECTRRAILRRKQSLIRAETFLLIVGGIKAGHWLDAARRAFNAPSAALLLRLPVWARLSDKYLVMRTRLYARRALSR